ncbi:MAG: hypothetical protein GY804_00740 [Alphaproteobacteria bacterium]|nr:hypothetical protein [Alphaproteobacteria bacterium]
MSYRSIFVIGLMVLSGCASSPENDPAYVSPMHYQSYNCNQISAEMLRVSSKVEQAMQEENTNQFLDTALAAFSISQGNGYGGGDKNTNLKRLNNLYDVLEQTAIRKECN